MAERAALLVTRILRRAVRARARATLFLAGGTTPLPLYARLAEGRARGGVSWRAVEVLWTDERCGPPEAPASNFRAAREALLDKLPVAPRAVHRIPGELGPERGADAYGQTLREVLGSRGRPDLVLLGLGADGHSASLFPRQEWDGDGWVVSGEAPLAPRPRISIALPLLVRARTVLLLASGPEKAEAVARLASREVPASQLRPGRLVWLLDVAAARGLALS